MHLELFHRLRSLQPKNLRKKKKKAKAKRLKKCQIWQNVLEKWQNMIHQAESMTEGVEI